MKTSFALVLAFAAIAHQLTAIQAQSLSAEAKERQDSCGGLVKPYPPKSTPATTAVPSVAPESPAPTGNPTVGVPSEAPTEGQCRWVCTGETGTTEEVTAESGVSGGVTGGVTHPSGSGSSQPGHVDFDCELTEAFYNISLILTVEEREIFIQWIEYIKVTILIDVTLTDIEKVVKCSLAFKEFCSAHLDIYYKIAFEFIGSWGRCIDFIYVEVDLQAAITAQIVTLDSNGDCTLFEALLNATENDQQKYQAVLVLIEELRVEVFENVELTYAQKLAKCHEIFVSFFEVHAEWESFFFSITIVGFGEFESFFDVCHGYHLALTIGVVINGSNDSDCVLLAALTNATANTTLTISVRNQIKQLHDKLLAYWAIDVTITGRLQYVSAQCYQLFLVEEFIIEFLEIISCYVEEELWGIFYDILWCSQFCHNTGSCGDLDHGMGTSPAPSTTSSVATTKASTATTEVPTTTPAPADCSKRPELIAISSSNTTILTDCLTENYNTWNTSVRLGFNSYFNQIRKAIWDDADFPTVAIKINDIVTYFKNYNANNVNAQNVVMNITIVEWRGTIRQFCDCPSAT